jgi:hypothetical protein
VLLALPRPHHWNAQVKAEGDNDMQEHEYSGGTGAQGVATHGDMYATGNSHQNGMR